MSDEPDADRLADLRRRRHLPPNLVRQPVDPADVVEVGFVG